MGALLQKADELYAECNGTDYSLEVVLKSMDAWACLHLLPFVGFVVFGFVLLCLLLTTYIRGDWKVQRQVTCNRLFTYVTYIVVATGTAIYCYLSVPGYAVNAKDPGLRAAMYGGHMLPLAILNHVAIDTLPQVRRVAFANTHIRPPEFPALRKFEIVLGILPSYLTVIGVATYAGSDCHAINNHFRVMALGCGLSFITILFSWVWFYRRALESINAAKRSSNTKWEHRTKSLKRKIQTLALANVSSMLVALSFSVAFTGTSLIDDYREVGMFNRITCVVLLVCNTAVQFKFAMRHKSVKVAAVSLQKTTEKTSAAES